nr:DUF892 family protein [uncultured Dyadobacter sp.]
MEAVPTLIPASVSLRSALSQAMQAEQQISSIIPRVMQAVWSTELSRALRSALALSEQHQLKITGKFGLKPGKRLGPEMADIEQHIMRALDGPQPGGMRDLSLTLLVARIIQHKISCYESLLGMAGKAGLQDARRLLGAALSDETATDLFLQELIERFTQRKCE